MAIELIAFETDKNSKRARVRSKKIALKRMLLKTECEKKNEIFIFYLDSPNVCKYSILFFSIAWTICCCFELDFICICICRSEWKKKTQKPSRIISSESLFFSYFLFAIVMYTHEKQQKKNKSRSELRRETKSEKFEERKCAHNRWVKSLDKYRVSLHLRWSEYSMACDIFSTLNHCRRTKKMQSYFSLWNLR